MKTFTCYLFSVIVLLLLSISMTRAHNGKTAFAVPINKIVIEEAVPMRQQRIHGKVVDDLIDLEVPLDQLPCFLVRRGIFECFDDGDQVLMALVPM